MGNLAGAYGYIMKKLYLLSNDIKWSTFKKLHDRIVRDSGPKPQQMKKGLWKLLREKRIYCGYTNELPNDLWVGRELPKDYKIELLTNAK